MSVREFNGKKYIGISHWEARELFFGGRIDELFVRTDDPGCEETDFELEPVKLNLPAYLLMDSDTSHAEFYVERKPTREEIQTRVIQGNPLNVGRCVVVPTKSFNLGECVRVTIEEIVK